MAGQRGLEQRMSGQPMSELGPFSEVRRSVPGCRFYPQERTSPGHDESSVLCHFTDIVSLVNVRFAPIVLKKSFLADN
jgi:hypothetical protein